MARRPTVTGIGPHEQRIMACMSAAARPEVGRLAELLRERRTLVLTGAGISTESGIPDYRGPQGTLRTRAPVQYRAFVGSPDARRRYWARSMIGWPRMAAVRPNAAHKAVARLEETGIICGVLTQNVDRLHQAAGSRQVLELHGALVEVRCLACGALESRAALQDRLVASNPGWASSGTAQTAPDGDAELADAELGGFVVPECLRCGGVLKPDVVFFGETVPRERVERAWKMLGAADVLLVLGSSLAVFSGYRFVARAARDGKPVAIVNEGPTRGDPLAVLRLHGRLGVLLPELVGELAHGAGPGHPSGESAGTADC